MDQPTRPPPALRLTAFAGTLAALALVGAFFLPLLSVDPDHARRFADAVIDGVEPETADDPLLADFANAFATVGETGEIRPADLLHYARTAPHVRERLRDAERGRKDPTTATPLERQAGESPSYLVDRLLTVLALLVGGVPIGAGILVVYFVGHRFRRARSPGLILAFVVGVAGLLVPVAFRYASLQLEDVAQPAIGFGVQTIASAALVLTTLFGVSVRNWWRVYGGSVITTGALAILAWVYCTLGAVA